MEAREKKVEQQLKIYFPMCWRPLGSVSPIVHESDEHDYYDQDLHESIADHAKALGFYVEFFQSDLTPKLRLSQKS